MKIYMRLLFNTLAMMLSTLLLCSCVEKDKKTEATPPPAPEQKAEYRTVIEPTLLPNRFRQTGYMIDEGKGTTAAHDDDTSLDKLQLKVGAKITTRQPVTLREAMKAIVKSKNMSLSWASDVNQDSLVDIDVNPNDNFYEAIDNILRQLDYFHEMEGSTMVIKYRETKQYHVAMPFIKQEYSSTNGVKSLDSFAKLGSEGNTFDIWENIQKNIDSIISTWSTKVTLPETQTPKAEGKDVAAKDGATKKDGEEEPATTTSLSRRVSSTESTYTIDKPVGLITVHAPKSLQEKIASYLSGLEKELYKQIVIEAKIIEVQLDDSSSLGVNWHQILDNLAFNSNSSSQRTKTYNRDVGDRNYDYSGNDAYTQSSSEKSRTKTSNRDNSSTSSSEYNVQQSGSNDASSSSSNSTSTQDGDTTTSNTYEELANSVLGATNSSDLSGSGSNTNSSSDVSSSSSSITSSSTGILQKTVEAATLVTTGTNIAESLSVGASLITSFSFPDFIKALQSQGQTSVLSNPKISVMNGQPALISVGKNVTYIDKVEATVSDTGQVAYTITTDKVLSGIGLAISAVVKDDNTVIMNLVPITSELTEPIEYREFGLGSVGLPVVNMREMNTTVKIKDGSMLVVGGLISDKEVKSGENFVPGTKDIPYLKYLFGYEEKAKTKRELIILLRPRIIN